jgi:hypothetical protein
MKRRIAAVVLVICLLICFNPGFRAKAASDVCFISVNDMLLELSSMPYISGNTIYVPYWVFSNYFNIYYSYFSESATASLYTAEKQFYFDLSSGNTYDSLNNYFSASAIFRGGQVYVPLSFVCSNFGLNYSYITGGKYGDVVRIKDSSVVLSDSYFMSAASSLMESRYNAYKGITPTPTTSVPVTQDPDPDGEDESHQNTTVFLSFQGVPGSRILDSLRGYGVDACFFLTPDEIRENQNTVREIVGSGLSIGILCGVDAMADYELGSSLIFEIAFENTILVSAEHEYASSCREMASQNSLVFWSYDIDGVKGGAGVSNASYITSLVEPRESRADIRLYCCENTENTLPAILGYLISNDYNLQAPRETDNYEG